MSKLILLSILILAPSCAAVHTVTPSDTVWVNPQTGQTKVMQECPSGSVWDKVGSNWFCVVGGAK